MEGTNNQKLTSEAMLAEARAFEREVTRGKAQHGNGGVPSQRPGSYGSGARAATGTPRGVSRQPVAQNLATPDQFFGRQSHPPPSAPRAPTMAASQQPASRPADDYEPMQVDPNPAVAQDVKAGRGLVGSRWATSVSSNTISNINPVGSLGGMNVDRVALPKQAPQNVPSRASAPAAPTYAAIDTGKAGAITNKAPTIFQSTQNTTLDTPEMPRPSKGLLGSKWASGSSPTSPSPMALKYPDPSTLQPVYRSEDWLSDLSAEYEELSIKTKNASETQATRSTPLTQPTGVQTAAKTAKPPVIEPQQFSQNPTNFSAVSQKKTVMQSAAPVVAPNQASETNPVPSVESGRTAPSVQAASNQGGIFNDSAFKDWYNSQFMRRNA